MNLKDYTSRMHMVPAIFPISGAGDNTAQVSAIIDTVDFDGVMFAIALGAIADADATFALTMDHGDAANLSDAVAVPADMLNSGRSNNNAVTALTSASFQFDSDNKTRKIGYHGDKRYCRITITPSANTGAWLVSAIAMLFGGRRQPAAVPPQ